MSDEAWCALGKEEEDAVWNRFESEFLFKPTIYPKGWPSISDPSPSVTYAIAPLDIVREEKRFWQGVNEIHRTALAAFRHCVPPGQRLYALDWNHQCYSFDPHAPSNSEDIDHWRVLVYPDADYYIFLAQDFSFGTFGHPWEQTLCVFGQPLINEFERNCPTVFQVIKRK